VRWLVNVSLEFNSAIQLLWINYKWVTVKIFIRSNAYVMMPHYVWQKYCFFIYLKVSKMCKMTFFFSLAMHWIVWFPAPKGLFPPEPEHYRGPKLKVAIIGAGLAGMSTAVELLDQGHEVFAFSALSCVVIWSSWPYWNSKKMQACGLHISNLFIVKSKLDIYFLESLNCCNLMVLCYNVNWR
jgi:hypothetical protein